MSSRNPPPAARGVFVVFEGIDGAGTTTQIEHYAQYLRGKGRDVHVTREPSDHAIGVFIREVLTGKRTLASQPEGDLMALLFAADRIDHVRGEIQPALSRGAVVLSDRYDLSSLAYQSVASTSTLPAHELVAWIREANRFARRPDATVVLDVSADLAGRRRKARGLEEDLYEKDALQVRLARAYARAEALVPGDKVLHVRGDGDVDTVARLVREALQSSVERQSPNT